MSDRLDAATSGRPDDPDSHDLNDGESPTAVSVDALAARSFGQHTVSAFARAEGDLDPDRLNPRFIGGFQNLSGFGEGELIGNVTALGGLRYYRRFGFQHPFGNEAFAGSSVEFGGAYADWGDIGADNGILAGSVFAGVQSPFGSLILGFGAAEQGNYSGTFDLGFQF